MRRREFIAFVGAAAAAWPRAARAQPPDRLPTIGFLGAGSPAAWGHYVAAFEQRLRERGWIDGRTVTIVYRWAQGRSERYAEIAAEFVRLKVDVIVTSGSAISAVKQQTATIPIVFAVAVDPVGSGMVASLARPGGNVTGLSIESVDLGPKRLELLREIIPSLRRLAILADVGYPAAALEMADVAATARKLGLDADTLEIRGAEDIAPAFAARIGGAQALYVCTDALVAAHRSRISDLAIAARLPTIVANREWVEDGALVSYGPNERDFFARAADYVDKILRGTKPADIPVEEPTKFELVVNLKTAKAIGLTVPEPILIRADEVIE